MRLTISTSRTAKSTSTTMSTTEERLYIGTNAEPTNPRPSGPGREGVFFFTSSIERGKPMSESNGVRVGVVGATGAVGEVLLRVLEERDFPVAKLRPLASGRSAGTSVPFRGEDVEVGIARPEAFDGLDVV